MAITVFIVEDSKPAADSLVELLTALGDVEVVGNASSEYAATDWLLNHSKTCDLLITDLILLPGGSGFGIIKHAANLGAFKHVIVFSNFVTPAVAAKCKKLGADAVFLKSELDSLVAYVRALRDR
jgi:DNA-binding NarL/FixJ family response regulator